MLAVNTYDLTVYQTSFVRNVQNCFIWFSVDTAPAKLSIFQLPNTAVSPSCICVPQPEKYKLEIAKFRAFIAIMPNSLTQ